MFSVGGMCQGSGIFLSHNGVSPCMTDLKGSGFCRIVIAGYGNFHTAFITEEQCVGCRVIWTGQHDRNIRQGVEHSSVDGKRKRKTAVRILLDDDFNLIFVLDTLRQGVFGYADGDSLFEKTALCSPVCSIIKKRVPEIRSVVSSKNSEKTGFLESIPPSFVTGGFGGFVEGLSAKQSS